MAVGEVSAPASSVWPRWSEPETRVWGGLTASPRDCGVNQKQQADQRFGTRHLSSEHWECGRSLIPTRHREELEGAPIVEHPEAVGSRVNRLVRVG
jgi:hypothetical protein